MVAVEAGCGDLVAELSGTGKQDENRSMHWSLFARRIEPRLSSLGGAPRLSCSIAAQFGARIGTSAWICSHPVCLFLRVLQPNHRTQLQLQPYSCTRLQTIQGNLGNRNFVSASSSDQALIRGCYAQTWYRNRRDCCFVGSGGSYRAAPDRREPISRTNSIATGKTAGKT